MKEENTMEKQFEKAMRGQYRYAYRGAITTEDLWVLDLVALDAIYGALNKELKGFDEESLLSKETDSRVADSIDILKTKRDIVKYIFEVKLAEENKRKKAAENALLKKRLTEILAEKQDAALKDLTEEELIEKINELS